MFCRRAVTFIAKTPAQRQLNNPGRAQKKTQASPNYQPGEFNLPDEPNHLIGGSQQPCRPGTALNQQPPGKTQLYIYTPTNPDATSPRTRQSPNTLPPCRNTPNTTPINNKLTQFYKNTHKKIYKH